jgi:hypothetical protein
VNRQFTRGTVYAILLLVITHSLNSAEPYPWPRQRPGGDSLSKRIQPPLGYKRIPAKEESFASWLRGLPLRPPGTPVRLFDGSQKARKEGVFAVVDLDVGSKDLQQCADAVIRLRAEYLFALDCTDRIVFDFTSGDPARWSAWSMGWRPVVSKNRVTWALQRKPDSTYKSFRNYLNTVFANAGSYSLSRQLEVVADPSTVLPGDVFIMGGFPGHAVLVADVAENDKGQRVFLLLQSYMPAQDVHVLINPTDSTSPWYPALNSGVLSTPDWIFSYANLKRFPEPDCMVGGNNGSLPNNSAQKPKRSTLRH